MPKLRLSSALIAAFVLRWTPQSIRQHTHFYSQNKLLECLIEHNIDYHGNTVINKTTTTHQDCADLTASTPGGLFWSWNTTRKHCYVKSSNAGALEHDHVISGTGKCGSMRLGGKYNVIPFEKVANCRCCHFAKRPRHRTCLLYWCPSFAPHRPDHRCHLLRREGENLAEECAEKGCEPDLRNRRWRRCEPYQRQRRDGKEEFWRPAVWLHGSQG